MKSEKSKWRNNFRAPFWMKQGFIQNEYPSRIKATDLRLDALKILTFRID
jgi:hypothetical protein